MSKPEKNTYGDILRASSIMGGAQALNFLVGMVRVKIIAVLSMALPGGEQLEKMSDNEYKAAMNVKVGPVQGKFDGKVELSNIAEPDTYTMKVSGQGAPWSRR